MIVIRPARPEEFMLMAEKGREFHAATEYRAIPYDPVSMMQTFAAMLEHGLLLIAEQDGAILGGIGGLKFNMFFNADTLCACERFWWLDPNYRNSRVGLELLIGIEAAALQAGCQYWLMLALEGDNGRADTIYRRFGYQPVERAYLKSLA